jgi:uncharacterized membrane protein HdeD (DUF308 family)
MSTEVVDKSAEGRCVCRPCAQLHAEFRHLKAAWWWLLLFGVLLVLCGTAALVVPPLTITTSFVAVVVLGVTLMVAGLATIINSFWVGKWSGMLLQMLIGILYLVVGFTITDTPGRSVVAITALLAAFFIVAGLFRIVAALIVRFPYWGWALLNGFITLMLGLVIYRHFSQAPLQTALWVIGILVGVEMLFHGWTWIMLSLAIRRIPEVAD